MACFTMVNHKYIILFLCCAVSSFLGLAGCRSYNPKYVEIPHQKLKNNINNSITNLYPDRFKAIHHVILTLSGKDYVLDGYLFINRSNREIKILAQNDLGGIIFNIHFIENIKKAIDINVDMLKKKWLEKTVLRDLEILYLKEPLPSPTLFSDQHKNFVLSQKNGSLTQEFIYKQINGQGRYQLNEIRHLKNKECIYSVRLKYGIGPNYLYPEFILIKDEKMKYKLRINVQYFI